MAQKGTNTFGIMFLVIVLGMAIILIFFLFGANKKERHEATGEINVENVAVLNKDTGKVENNLKKMADDEMGKIEVKQDINVDMKKLFEDKEKEGDENKEKGIVGDKDKLKEKKEVKTDKPRNITKIKKVEILEKKEDSKEETVKKEERHRTGFNDSGNDKEQVNGITENKSSSTVIKVVVHSEQKVKNGSSVRMRATEDFMLAGNKIPRNTFISGMVMINNQRVNIHVPTIEFKGKLYTVNYTVYDNGDGLEGANVPDMMIHDASKEEVSNAMDKAGQVRINTPLVSVPVGSGRKAIQESTALLTENYKLILRSK